MVEKRVVVDPKYYQERDAILAQLNPISGDFLNSKAVVIGENLWSVFQKYGIEEDPCLWEQVSIGSQKLVFLEEKFKARQVARTSLHSRIDQNMTFIKGVFQSAGSETKKHWEDTNFTYDLTSLINLIRTGYGLYINQTGDVAVFHINHSGWKYYIDVVGILDNSLIEDFEKDSRLKILREFADLTEQELLRRILIFSDPSVNQDNIFSAAYSDFLIKLGDIFNRSF